MVDRQTTEDRERLFNLLDRVPKAVGLRGKVFEAHVHSLLASGGTFARRGVHHSNDTLTLRPSPFPHRFTLSSIMEIPPETYAVLSPSNFESFNSV